MTRLTSLAALIISALVLSLAPAAPAAAVEQGKTATAKVAKQVKKLKRQVKQLRQQVEDASKLSGQQGPEGPAGAPGPAIGPAGGDLTGTYPNPVLGPDAVAGAEILDGQVGTPDLAPQAVSGAKIQDGAVGGDEIQDLSITGRDLSGGSVGAIELKAYRSVVGEGVSVDAGTTRTATVTCPELGTAIGGGFAWQDDEPNSIIYSVPEETNSHTWAVRGTVPAGSNNLYAWARCVDR